MSVLLVLGCSIFAPFLSHGLSLLKSVTVWTASLRVVRQTLLYISLIETTVNNCITYEEGTEALTQSVNNHFIESIIQGRHICYTEVSLSLPLPFSSRDHRAFY